MVIEPKTRGETDIGCGFKLRGRGTVSSGKAREGVERNETESTETDKDNVSPRFQNADIISDDNGDKPEDVTKPEPRAKLTTSVAHELNQAGVGCQTAESTVQGLPGIDSSVCGRPSRQRKPPSRFGTWVTD